MKFKTLLTLTLWVICGGVVHAQSLTKLVNDTTLSYYDIKKKIKENPGYIKNASL